MKELTTIVNIQVTGIAVLDDEIVEIIEQDIENIAKGYADTIKALTGADDVIAIDRKLFIRDLKEKTE